MLKVGLVGVGNVTGAHIPAWQEMEDARLVAMCDVRPEQMDPYDDVRKYTDFDEMLRNEELDIVDICLPTFLHADAAVKAMEHGIHVVCEKPISLNKEDVARIYATAERCHIKFMVAQVLRFWPQYEFVRSLYQSGKYGKLLSGTMLRLGNRPGWSWDDWMCDEQRSGLVPFDLHIHDLDFMVYAFGKPKQVHAFRSKRPEQDCFSAVYEFDGFYINSEASWYGSPYPFGASFRFQFEKAVVANEGNGLVVYERGGGAVVQEDFMQDVADDSHLPQSNAYANELLYFVNCVKNDLPIDKFKPEELETVIDILHSI